MSDGRPTSADGRPLKRQSKGTSNTTSFRLATLAALTLYSGLLVISQASTGILGVSAAPSVVSAELSEAPSIFLAKRHGDHEHEDEQPEEHMTSTMHMEDSHDEHHHEHPVTSPHHTESSHSHGHGHSHAPAPHVPSMQEIGSSPFITPYFVGAHTGGHSHGNSNAPPEIYLNETNLLMNKGPEPLSYLEWDFDYGLGAQDALRHFTSQAFQDAAKGSKYGVMGVLGDRYRTLLDEVDPDQLARVTQDIASRVGTSEEPLQPGRHKWLMLLHIVGASVSCFVLLPLSLFLRAAKSSLAPLASLVYLSSLTGSLLLSSLYKALTPRLYPSNAHGSMGWTVLWISVACLGGDIFSLAWKMLQVISSAGGSGTQKLRSLFRIATSGEKSSGAEQYAPMDPEEEERMLSSGDDRVTGQRPQHSHRVHFSTDDQDSPRYSTESPNWSGSGSTAAPSYSDGAASPTSTLIGSQGRQGRQSSLTEAIASAQFPWKLTSPTSSYQSHPSAVANWTRDTSAAGLPIKKTRHSRATIVKNILHYTHVVVSRALPIVSFAAAYTGLAVYTGTCRQPYKNVCLAHGIKGGIFFWYGLLTFGRYLGAYADCGWAWNRRPSPESAGRKGGTSTVAPRWKASMPSAEWVECLVIFIYGATNTWMERFSAQPGDPYTVKQVQHISIAVMYWFAGALGVLLETRWVRNLLSVPVALNHPSAREASSQRVRRGRNADAEQEPIVAAQEAPPSYSGSFNPFPALCVGVTGIAMAAHHQDYLYEVKIHELWGQLLAGFAVLRCITYFFLWLRPPMSILPSRPPTEALASFSLAAGGLVFMISSEEVSFAAMRNGFDDFMAIMCITVAVICFIFALIAGLMIVKAWAVRREMRRSHRSGVASSTRSHSGVEHDGEAQQNEQSQSETVFILGEHGDEEEEKQDNDEMQHAVQTHSTNTNTISPSRHLSASPDGLA